MFDALRWISWEAILNPLALFGFFGQLVFMMRFLVQWYSSEKRRRIHVPLSFWYLSCAGGLITAVYAYLRQDIVFLFAQMLGLTIYFRNIAIAFGHHSRQARGDLLRRLARKTALRTLPRNAAEARRQVTSHAAGKPSHIAIGAPIVAR